MSEIKKHRDLREKEIAILREAVDKAEERTGRKVAQSEQVKKIIEIVERFIREKKLICYGGTAINNILPVEDQFYNRDMEVPDYDFFSDNALEDAKTLADRYVAAGYSEVEAKAGVHHGTFKVYVDYIPVADVTQLDSEIFNAISKEAIRVNGIVYAPPNYLRMSMYLELSRPKGDVSRWEKVLKRLILLNKHYPIKSSRCHALNFMRSFETGTKENRKEIYDVVRDTLTDQGVVFLGGYAATLYGRYMPTAERKALEKNPDFDVLSEDPETSAVIVKERLEQAGFDNVKIETKPGIGENIASHYEVVVGDETVCFIYEPLACHSYNTLRIGDRIVKVATIDTMLSFFLAFLYADRPYYDHHRILCMAQYLFAVQAKNRLKQTGLLRRFSISCYGNQPTIEDVRAEKTKVYKALASKRGTKEYDEWFLRYVPAEKQKNKTMKNNRSDKTSKKSGRKRQKRRKSARKSQRKEYWH